MTVADAQEQQQQQLAQQQILQVRNTREHAAAATGPAPAPLPVPYTRPITAADILTGACSTRALGPARAPWGAPVPVPPSPLTAMAMYSPLHLGMQPQANMAATVAAVLTGQHVNTQQAATPSGNSNGMGGSGGQASSASPANSTATSSRPIAPVIPAGPLHLAQDRLQEQARADLTPRVMRAVLPLAPPACATLPHGPFMSARATPPHHHQAAATLTPSAGMHTPSSHGYISRHTPPSGGSSNHLPSSCIRIERPAHKPRVQIDANTLRGPNPYGFQPVLIMSPQEVARQQAEAAMGVGSRRLGSMAGGNTLYSRTSGRQQVPSTPYGGNAPPGRHGYTGTVRGVGTGYGAGAGQPVRSNIGSASSRMALSALSNSSAYSTTSRGGARPAGPVDFRPRWR